MNIKPSLRSAGIAVVGVSVLWYALGTFGILMIKNPFPQRADIYFSIKDSQLEISVSTGNRGGCVPKGCVHVSRWRKAHIRFLLDDMDDWEFSKIQLVAEPTPKLDFGNQAGFTQEMIDDFYVRINDSRVYPDTNGIIDLSGLKKGGEFKLVDRNKFEQTYSYQVQACPTASVDSNDCLDSDPKIINEGNH